tara:strand:- start:3102 stop:3716 length:615 start_codon:yes stop_codon:yes gene_type:complete
MGLLLPKNVNNEQAKFNGIRRTPDGMLYLTSIDPNVDNDSIQYSDYFESGKSDLVPKDGSDYVEERLELINLQYFTGDNSTTTFTLSSTGLTADQIAVFKDGTRINAFSDYTLSGTSLLFTIKPINNSVITVGQINKRYKNNDSDRYQQFTFDPNTTATYVINSSGDLVKRVNTEGGQTSTTDDFDTFESSTASVNSTTYQSAI